VDTYVRNIDVDRLGSNLLRLRRARRRQSQQEKERRG
jgi:hypothetical protein